jgi:hypothetical protein
VLSWGGSVGLPDYSQRRLGLVRRGGTGVEKVKPDAGGVGEFDESVLGFAPAASSFFQKAKQCGHSLRVVSKSFLEGFGGGRSQRGACGARRCM